MSSCPHVNSGRVPREVRYEFLDVFRQGDGI
jgi:hypothetical protein